MTPNSITEKDIGTQHSNPRLLLRTNTSPSPIWTPSFFRLRRCKNSQNLKDPEDRMFWQATSSSTECQQFGVSERNNECDSQLIVDSTFQIFLKIVQSGTVLLFNFSVVHS
jgi:hypothetical protein